MARAADTDKALVFPVRRGHGYTGILAEEDGYAENAARENLYLLDQFRATQAMNDKGAGIQALPRISWPGTAVVRQRSEIASASPPLHNLQARRGSASRGAAYRCRQDLARWYDALGGGGADGFGLDSPLYKPARQWTMSPRVR